MAKIKVYELAKELDKHSKEVVALLNEKGYGVKSHMSTIEDEAITCVRNTYKSNNSSQGNAGDKAVTKAPTPKQNDMESAEKIDDSQKKKKNIVFVSNPHNSRMPGQGNTNNNQQAKQNMNSNQSQNQNQNRNNQNNYNNRNGRPIQQQQQYRPLPKPIVKPAVLPRIEDEFATKESTNTQENTRPNTQQGTRPNTQQGTRPNTQQPRYNNNRTEGNQQRNSYNNQRSEGGYQNRGTGNNSYNNRNNTSYNNRNTDRPADGRNENRYDNRRPYDANRDRNGAGGTNGATGRPNYNGPRNNNGYNSNYNNRPGSTDNRRPNSYNSNNNGRPNSFNNDRRNGEGGFNRNKDGQQRPWNNNGNDNRNQNGFKRQQSSAGFSSDTPMKDVEKHREEEKRRQGQERDKRSKKDSIYEDGKASKGAKVNKPGRFIKPEKKEVVVQEEQIKVIVIPESLTIKELAEKMKMQPSAIVKKLFLQGQIVTVNQEISYETAEEIAIEYEIICEKEVKIDVIEELLKEEDDKDEEMSKRPPVICVMGHVDHGKTSLLDGIRKSNVTDREAGGITQHIGAYTVTVNDEKITFLDTPGHEAFTAMRMRGANSTDIAVLVVAADDGVMPQTVEAINHAKAAEIEIIVAVNKIDKPNANIDRVKQELAEYELIPVDWGGTTEFVPVSAKSGEGISDLLETIILTSEILELKANPDRKARGLVIEAELDKGRGPVATVLVQKGTLHVGDFISAGASHGKVRAMIDDKGRRVKEALPSTPVEILGLSDVPNAGEIFISHENDKTAKNFADTFIAQNKEKKLEETKSKMSLDDLFSKIKEGNLKELDLIIKADVQGSVEAVKQSLLKLSNDEVVVKCIHGGVGAINESDVILASASSAIIIGFNVRPDATAKVTAEREGVDVRLYKVIYQAIEDVQAAMKGMLDPIFEEQVIGHAEVRQIFKASAVGNISGSYVLDGRFERNAKVRITREGEQIYEGELASLKRFKDDVKEVKSGFECGLVFDGFDQVQELDIVEAYIMVEVPR